MSTRSPAVHGPELNNSLRTTLQGHGSYGEDEDPATALEAYNVFNHTQFDSNGVNGNVSTGPSGFGTMTAPRTRISWR
jgi:hypothetical protein